MPIALTDIQRFRDYLRTIPFRYSDTSPTILGRELTIEDVRTFFDSSILLVVWPVILAMVPTIRNVDLRLASESPLPGAVKHRPDATIYACGTGYEAPVAHIEYKAPQCLASFQEVVSQQVPEESDVSASPNTSEESLSPAWVKITRQLRKYAENGSPTVLCSDGSEAYVFIFPDNDSSTDVLWLRASDDGSAILTLRECVLFLLFFAINSGPHFNLRYVLITF